MPRPNANVMALRRIMQQQLAIARALVALAEATQRAIIDGDTVRLDALGLRQRSLIDQQIAHETIRQQVTRELACVLGLDHIPTLSTLLPVLPPAEALALDHVREQILKTGRTMDSLNRHNSRLLENALAYVKFSLEALTSAALKPARYGVNLAQLAAPAFYIDSRA